MRECGARHGPPEHGSMGRGIDPRNVADDEEEQKQEEREGLVNAITKCDAWILPEDFDLVPRSSVKCLIRRAPENNEDTIRIIGRIPGSILNMSREDKIREMRKVFFRKVVGSDEIENDVVNEGSAQFLF